MKNWKELLMIGVCLILCGIQFFNEDGKMVVSGIETHFVILSTEGTGVQRFQDLLRTHDHLCVYSQVESKLDSFRKKFENYFEKIESTKEKSSETVSSSSSSSSSASKSSKKGKSLDPTRHHIGHEGKLEGISINEIGEKILEKLDSNSKCKYQGQGKALEKFPLPKFPYEGRGVNVDILNYCPLASKSPFDSEEQEREFLRKQELSRKKSLGEVLSSSSKSNRPASGPEQPPACDSNSLSEFLAALPDVKVILFRRENLFAQTLELIDLSYNWKLVNGQVDSRAVELSQYSVMNKLHLVDRTYQTWERLLKILNIEYYQLFAEKLEADPRGELRKVAAFLEVSPFAENPVTKLDSIFGAAQPPSRSKLPFQTRFSNWDQIARSIGRNSQFQQFVDPIYRPSSN